MGWRAEVLTPPPSSHISFLLLLLLFCADEIKDDFDTLGPDATLQVVGNGTGESLFPLTCDHSEHFTPRRPFKMSSLESGMFVLTGKTHSAGCFPQNKNIFASISTCRAAISHVAATWRQLLPSIVFSQPLIRLFPAPPPHFAVLACFASRTPSATFH